MFFAIGVDSENPERTIRAIAGMKTDVAGHDVGIYQLAEEPLDVQSIQIADVPLTQADIGSKLLGGGYGVRDPDDTWLDFLTRRTGELSVTTFDQQPIHVLFSSVAEFGAFLEEHAGKPIPTAAVQNSYDDALLTLNDVFVGASVGGSCSASTLVRCEGSTISLEECGDSGKTCSLTGGVAGCN